MTRRSVAILTAALLVALSIVAPAVAQRAARGIAAGEWIDYGGDGLGMKYSPLSQITADNVKDLQIAWRWTSADQTLQSAAAARHGQRYDATPLFARGSLYTVTPLGLVAALDPSKGQARWTYDPESYKNGRHAAPGYAVRGLAYWTDGTRERLLIATPDAYLISLDAGTGRPDPAFGIGGKVDVAAGVAGASRATNFAAAHGVLAGDLVIVGSSVHAAPTTAAPTGVVKAYDARTGALRWTFSTESPGVSAAVGMAYDPELAYVFVPTSSGSGPLADSLIAIDAKTGKRVWNFQTVHENIWGYELPAHPTLGEVTVNGRRIKAVMQIGEQNFVYAFDRKTGQPLWPIVETPIPAGAAARTQPIPSRPAGFDLQGAEIDHLIDYTPEVNEQAMETFQALQTGPLYTPPSEKGTLTVPSPAGGAGWGGAAFDPETGMLYVPSRLTFTIAGGTPPRTEALYISDLPMFRRPYSRVTAIDMNKGEHFWMHPIGNGPASSRAGGKHPILAKLFSVPPLPPLGDPIQGAAPLVTKTLLVVAVTNLTPSGEPQPAPWSKWVAADGPKKLMYVFDKSNGRPLHVVSLHDAAIASGAAPMTFLHQGKQYIVVASGAGERAELIAFALAGPAREQSP